MTKVALAVSNHGIMLGGGEYSFIDLLTRLPSDWSVLAVVPHEGELFSRLKEKGVKTLITPLPPLRPWFILQILATAKAFFHICMKYHPSLIYTNGSRATLYAGFVGRLTGFPVVWHCRIADRDIFLDFVLSRLSTKIVTNSRATANRFKHNLSAKIKVVYNGIDIGWLRDDSVRKPELIDEDWKVILVVARVSRWKRHDLALAAFEQIAATDPNAHLVCVGSSDALEPDWWKYLQERSRQSNFRDRIHWVDQVVDIRPWYKVAHLLLLPSDNEPFGRVVVEAMACGVPVVASRSGGLPEIVRHGQDGLLVTPGKVDEIADAMITILRDDQVRKDLVRSASARAELFSLDIHVNKITQIFEEAIHPRN